MPLLGVLLSHGLQLRFRACGLCVSFYFVDWMKYLVQIFEGRV